MYMDHALIISGCRQGDRQAQKKIFELYAQGLLAVCKRYVPNVHDAEELLLNGFYKFFSSVHTFEFRTEAGLSAWLNKIMVNECLMFLRRGSTMRFSEVETETGLAIAGDVWAGMNARALQDLINTMPDGYRVVFNLFVVEGFTHNEIAHLLGISAGTSKSQLMRAKLYLQRLLEKKGIVYGAGQNG